MTEYKTVYNDKNELNGYICKCGSIQRWPRFVNTHMNIELINKCTGCGYEVIIFEGKVHDNENNNE